MHTIAVHPLNHPPPMRHQVVDVLLVLGVGGPGVLALPAHVTLPGLAEGRIMRRATDKSRGPCGQPTTWGVVSPYRRPRWGGNTPQDAETSREPRPSGCPWAAGRRTSSRS